MFTNGVVASVKIYRDDGDDGSRLPIAVPVCGPHTASGGEATDGTDSSVGRGADGDPIDARNATAAVNADGPAPQEGSKT
ncbi:hypothetical protein [Halorubrum sp. DTA46]|uniref:hypothetical protein n=1 Tax=Halorubrum sp. DTA46 TaxID=3402162 RepID=UPI003AAFA3BA